MPTISYRGREVEATDIGFRQVREDWNEYELQDGTTLRMKTVVSDIVRVEGEYDNEGNPIYVVKSGNVLVVKAPDHLKQKK